MAISENKSGNKDSRKGKDYAYRFPKHVGSLGLHTSSAFHTPTVVTFEEHALLWTFTVRADPFRQAAVGPNEP